MNFNTKLDFIAYELKGVDYLLVKILKSQGYSILTWIIENDYMKKGYESSDNLIFGNAYVSKIIPLHVLKGISLEM